MAVANSDNQESYRPKFAQIDDKLNIIENKELIELTSDSEMNLEAYAPSGTPAENSEYVEGSVSDLYNNLSSYDGFIVDFNFAGVDEEVYGEEIDSGIDVVSELLERGYQGQIAIFSSENWSEIEDDAEERGIDSEYLEKNVEYIPKEYDEAGEWVDELVSDLNTESPQTLDQNQGNYEPESVISD